MSAFDKATLRAQMRAQLAVIGVAEGARRSAALAERLLGVCLDALPASAGAPEVMLFRAIAGAGEPDLTNLAAAVRRERPGVCFSVPLVDWDARTMTPVRVRGLRDTDAVWDSGPHGVAVPRNAEPVDPRALALVVCPGLAFDLRGGRLGRGGGFYDRFLAALSSAGASPRCVGACFDEQVVPRLPVEAHDCRMHAVITDLRRIIPVPRG